MTVKNGKKSTQGEKAWDPHLRSTHDVSGYHIQAADGEIGHVEDFIIDDETWAIRYLIVDTRNWWPGKKVLVSPQWIERVSWSESKVFVNLSRETIKQSPEYTEESLLTRDYETGLHRHYNRQGYWVDEPRMSDLRGLSAATSEESANNMSVSTALPCRISIYEEAANHSGHLEAQRPCLRCSNTPATQRRGAGGGGHDC